MRSQRACRCGLTGYSEPRLLLIRGSRHPRHHLLLSTAAAIAAYPWLGRRVVLPWAASLLIDLDHSPAYI